MKNVVIFGSGNVARLVHYFFENDSDRKVEAFTINEAYIQEETYLDLPLVSFENITKTHPPSDYDMFIAIGAQERNELREKVFNQAKDKGYTLASYVSSKAQYWPDLRYGENVFMIQATSIEPFVEIGNNVVLIGTKIGQSVRIEDHCFISTATIGSDVFIERNAFIGINALINPYIKIGTKSIIASGSIITKEVEPFSVYTAPSAIKSSADSRRIRIM